MSKTLAKLNAKGMYTKEQLVAKYAGRYVDTYPHHHEYWSPEVSRFVTVYEVRKVSKTVRENYQSPEDV